MTVKSRRYLFGLYVAAAVLVFLYISFPSEIIRAHLAYRLSAGLPGVSADIGSVRPALPLGLWLNGVRLMQSGRLLAVIDRLRVAPDLFSLWGDSPRYAFSGVAAAGAISGRTEIHAAGAQRPAVSLNAQIAGIRLEKLPALQGLYGSRISGLLSGELSSREPGALTGKLTVSEARVELAAPLFEVQSLGFRTIDTDLLLQNRLLTLRSCRLKGNELDAEVSGTVSLESPEADGQLNLGGRITPHQVLMAKMQASLPPNFMRRRGGISFKIGGTLAAPGFSLN
jgi:type II secretion system protein N